MRPTPLRLYDVTLALGPGLPVWPGDPPVALDRVSDVAAGDDYTLTRLCTSAHAGTHVDAPAHFLAGGGGVETLDLDAMIGRARVVDLPGADRIGAAELESADLPAGTDRVLFKTRNSARWRTDAAGLLEDFVALTADAARALVARGVRLVGIDGPSIAPADDIATPHVVLLAAGVVVVEGLDLSAVGAGDYELFCLPLKLSGADGAPARVVLGAGCTVVG